MSIHIEVKPHNEDSWMNFMSMHIGVKPHKTDSLYDYMTMSTHIIIQRIRFVWLYEYAYRSKGLVYAYPYPHTYDYVSMHIGVKALQIDYWIACPSTHADVKPNEQHSVYAYISIHVEVKPTFECPSLKSSIFWVTHTPFTHVKARMKIWGLQWKRVGDVRQLPRKLVGNFGSRDYFKF